jgi:hypothetical protein
MALENIYDEVNLKNESKSSGTDTDIPEGKKNFFLVIQINDEIKDEVRVISKAWVMLVVCFVVAESGKHRHLSRLSCL